MINTSNNYLEFCEIFTNDFLKTKEGICCLNKYIEYSNIKPRNIYTANTNFSERYTLENFIINLSLNFIFQKYGIERNTILEEIKEIDIYYPYQKIEEYYIFNSIEVDTTIDFKYWVKNLLEDFFKKIDQRQYGEYYTPEQLIKLSFNSLELNASQSVVDPACGSGFFLLEYMTALLEKELIKIEDSEELKKNIHGYDVFPFAIIMTKLLLGEFIIKNGGNSPKAFHFPNILIHNTVRSLACKKGNDKLSLKKYDLIIGNPPFFRIEPNDKNEICKCISYGHNYIHSIFVHWSIQHLSKNGQACLFLPQSILSGFYYQKLREELLSTCSLDLIISDKKHEKSFMVQQDIMIIYFSKSNSKNNYSIGLPNLDFTKISSFDVPLTLTLNKNNVIPVFKEDKQIEAAKLLAKNEILDFIDEFELGTGNFVWNQNKKLIFKEPIPNSVPLIMGPSVTSEGIFLNQAKFNYCTPNKNKYLRNERLILFRRMSPIGNSQRMIASIIDSEEIPVFVLENHINFIQHKDNNSKKLHDMLNFIVSNEFNVLLDSFCQTNQVSTNDILTIFEALNSLK
ncbi:HsdM family class I SAM-dependent methyltransferase [Bacillus cereus]|uniref:HsdM family class I SAM-dependent methyltransferase n=1 Tax=Bacillus cereus TaxID=1396 RepID=UPI00061DDD91|nr:N-6 DNA methylase [Bacillus cereus]AKE15348.1 Modification methylase PstI [Bacillus cereus]